MTQTDPLSTVPPTEQLAFVDVMPPIEYQNQTGYHWLKAIDDGTQLGLEFLTGEPCRYICVWWSARYNCWQDPIGSLKAVLCPVSSWEYVAPAFPPEK